MAYTIKRFDGEDVGMWYLRAAGSKWHFGKCDGTYTAKCGADLRVTIKATEHMAEVAACKHCWRVYAKGFDKAA